MQSFVRTGIVPLKEYWNAHFVSIQLSCDPQFRQARRVHDIMLKSVITTIPESFAGGQANATVRTQNGVLLGARPVKVVTQSWENQDLVSNNLNQNLDVATAQNQ
jgi:hypothetical protein